MFERYTEQARRVVFFARYEASVFGSPYIEAEHLVLGMLREPNVLKNRLSAAVIDDIRREIERDSPERESISTSVDLPVSHELKRALATAAEEATALGHKNIDVGHLVLGLLQTGGKAKELLGRHGIGYSEFREIVRRAVPAPPARFHVPPAEFEPVEFDAGAAAPSMRATIMRLDGLIQRMVHYAETQSEAYGYKRLKRKPWSRAEAVGHLLDWATTHHGWFARAMAEPALTATAYPADEWVPAQKYQDFGWPEIVQLWAAVNRLLVHVLMQVPEEKMDTPCRIGLSDPVPLSKLASDYVDHCDDIIGQVLARL